MKSIATIITITTANQLLFEYNGNYKIYFDLLINGYTDQLCKKTIDNSMYKSKITKYIKKIKNAYNESTKSTTIMDKKIIGKFMNIATNDKIMKFVYFNNAIAIIKNVIYEIFNDVPYLIHKSLFNYVRKATLLYNNTNLMFVEVYCKYCCVSNVFVDLTQYQRMNFSLEFLKCTSRNANSLRRIKQNLDVDINNDKFSVLVSYGDVYFINFHSFDFSNT